jgi:hypothetical protein
VDLGYRGASYTWNNNRDDEANIQGRLDRALATSAWLDWFPSIQCVSLPRIGFRSFGFGGSY